MKKGILIITLLLALLIIPQVSAFSIEQDVFGGYKYLLTTGRGNEGLLFNVEITGTNICLASKIVDGAIIEGVRYNLPADISVRNGDGKISYTPTRDGSDKYCIDVVNPLLTTFLKFGERSIIIDGDVSYSSTDINITQETGSAHLSIDNSTGSFAEGLQFYMSMNIDESPLVSDVIGGFDGVLLGDTGTPLLIQGGGHDGVGGAYEFTRVNGHYIDMGDIKKFDPGFENFSINIWANATGGNVAVSNIFQKRGGGTQGTNPGWQMTTRTQSGNWRIDETIWEDIENDFVEITGSDVCLGCTGNGEAWAMFTMVRAGQNFSLYIDGVLDGSVIDLTVGNISTNNHFTVGAAWSPGNITSQNFNGRIDEPMYFDRALTSAEILDLFNNTGPLYFPTGEMLFENQDITTFDRQANVSVTTDTPGITAIEFQINNGTREALVGGVFNNYNIDGIGDMNDANFTLFFTAGTNQAFTPTIIGNITILTFDAPPDATPPVISNVSVSSITTNSADVNWNTDESSNSTVEFGTTPSLGGSAGQDDAVTTHLVALSGLDSFTLYFFNVTSCDSFGNCATSGPFNFTTLLSIPNATLLGSVSINDLTAPKGQPLDLKAVCLDNTNDFCNLGTNCSLTLFDPTLNLVADNERMSFNPSFFNLTLNETQTLPLGAYSGTIVCEGLDIVTDTFVLTITPSGAGALSSGQGFILFAVLGIIIIIAILFLVGGFKSEHVVAKTFLISFGAITVLIAILYALLVLNEVVAQSPVLVQGFETFYFVMKILGTIGIVALIVILLMVFIRAWKVRRGLIDK